MSADSTEFKNWFGNSQAVDGDGKPEVMYHGTQADFDQFDPNRFGQEHAKHGFGFHFTNSPGEASIYGAGIETGTRAASYGWKPTAKRFNHDTRQFEPMEMPSGAKVLPVYLKAENPLVVHTHHPAASMEADFNKDAIKKALATAKSAGKPHDSVIIHTKNGNKNVIVFDPRQVKSATGNRGKFDKNDPDITKASGGIIDNALRIARSHGGHVAHGIKLHVGPIHSKVSGRTDHLPVHVASGSYVLPADIVSAMGEGNTTAGFEHVKRIFGGLPYGGKGDVPYAGGEGPYGSELPRSSGGAADNTGAPVACVLAGGEYVLAPHEVLAAGDGDMDAGHRALDDFVKQYRAKTIKTLKGLPGPRRD